MILKLNLIKTHFYLKTQDEEKRTAVYVSLRILYQAEKQELLNFCREKSHAFHVELEKDPIIRDLVKSNPIYFFLFKI